MDELLRLFPSSLYPNSSPYTLHPTPYTLTIAPFPGSDGIETVLDAQVAATKGLLDSLIGQGYGDRINIGLIPHSINTQIQDMNPNTAEIDFYATPNTDANNNGVPDIREILDGYTSRGSNTETLERIETLVGVLPGDPNVIFMSDGYGHLDEDIAARVVSVTCSRPDPGEPLEAKKRYRQSRRCWKQ